MIHVKAYETIKANIRTSKVDCVVNFLAARALEGLQVSLQRIRAIGSSEMGMGF
jgi:hypothetical protein